jgi:hypothetical protein
MCDEWMQRETAFPYTRSYSTQITLYRYGWIRYMYPDERKLNDFVASWQTDFVSLLMKILQNKGLPHRPTQRLISYYKQLN